MAKSVTEFLLGIDLSSVSLDSKDFTSTFSSMKRLQWLKLSSAGLEKMPKGIENLTQLQRLTVSKNNIDQLSGDWYNQLKSLRVFIARKNKIIDESLPEEFFCNPQLQVVDLSFNELTEVPRGLLIAKSLLVLNLSNNQISSVPKDLFANCVSLKLLDLSNNQIDSFPTNLRRMPNLQSLNLANNPLSVSQLRSITGLKQLTTLSLCNTSRRLDNFPSDLDKLQFLTDLDVSENGLPKVPQTIYEINSLIKLNLSGNNIDELSSLVECWPNLEVLNLSRNHLNSIPSFITRLSKLKKLYVDNNQLTFNGIPPSIGKLSNLEVFSASENNLENIPESLCRCGQLKHLNLQMNRLVTLPDAIHFLIETLVTFNVEHNPSLKMPPKLDETDMKRKYAFYNIDFSLETQMQLARGAPIQSGEKKAPLKDTAARIRRMRRKRQDSMNKDDKSDSMRVLEGMQKVAKEKEKVIEEHEQEPKFFTSKRWKDALSKPNLDYSQIFEDNIGNSPGIEIWEIDDFNPRKINEEIMLGTFYNGDCYIVLNTVLDSNNQLCWSIYYWIGKQATLDKVTCSAVHAVNLRNYLGAENRCERIEQEDESDEFKNMFGGQIQVIDGAHGESGFMKLENKPHRKKLYRLYGADRSISVYACDPRPESLDSKFVYLFDESNTRIFIWFGKQSRLMLQSKGRLLADKINKRERKGKGEIVIERDQQESQEFKQSLEDSFTITESRWGDSIRNIVPNDWRPSPPLLYDVKLGKGFLEMPQVEMSGGRLLKELLQPKHVYILDSNGDIFVWIGDMAPKFLKFAGIKLSYELVEMLPRRTARRSPIICSQSAESQIFKLQFTDWEDTVAVDFTRSAESVRKRGVDMNDIMERDKMKIDMRAFFMPREKQVSWEDAKSIMDECNDDLVTNDNQDDANANINPFRLKQFVYQNKKWLPVEERWVGHFFMQDCYIINVEYWEIPEDDETPEDEQDDDEDGRTQRVIYFWQGREASDIPWLQFNFSLRKDMEDKFGSSGGSGGGAKSKGENGKVDFKRMYQQQEMSQFLAHFQYQFIIHLGRYQDRKSNQRKGRVEFYCTRSNGNPMCTRTIEMRPLIGFLNSYFHYILKVPAAHAGTDTDQVICWVGRGSDRNYNELIEQIAEDLFRPEDNVVITTVQEGEEPDFFWSALGGKRPYDTTADFMHYSRLFRLSNEQGFFCASEKCRDFCQDDLADEDVMLLDTGSEIYLWFGSRTSDVEKKLSLQAAKLYKEHMARIQPDRSRSMKITNKKMEPHRFRRCFHGWGPFKEAKDWSG